MLATHPSIPNQVLYPTLNRLPLFFGTLCGQVSDWVTIRNTRGVRASLNI